MSQHGRGSGPVTTIRRGGNRKGAAAGRRPSAAPAPPIAPHNPYRPVTGDRPRPPMRNIAADPFKPSLRPPHAADDDPFLPADDPLSAEAWQLELDEAPPGEMTRRPCPSSTSRRLSRRACIAAIRCRREAAANPHPGSGERPHVAVPVRQAARPRRSSCVTIAVPRVVAGSSPATDQTALALIGINAASVLVMALLLAMQMGGIPSPAVIRLDAAGNPALWGHPSALWRSQ